MPKKKYHRRVRYGAIYELRLVRRRGRETPLNANEIRIDPETEDALCWIGTGTVQKLQVEATTWIESRLRLLVDQHGAHLEKERAENAKKEIEEARQQLEQAEAEAEEARERIVELEALLESQSAAAGARWAAQQQEAAEIALEEDR